MLTPSAGGVGDVVGLVAQLVLDVVQLTPTRPVPLPASVGVQGRSSFFGKAIPRVAQAKQFKTYTEQVELLRGRGMRIDDQDRAEHLLARLNYYRLSGYWYPMRRFTDDKGAVGDEFVAGASLDLVVDLYKFDERLRHSVFIELEVLGYLPMPTLFESYPDNDIVPLFRTGAPEDWAGLDLWTC